MSACDSLRKMSVGELVKELDELESDWQQKILTTDDYYECVRLVKKVLAEKIHEQHVADAYKRAMVGI